MYEVKSIITVEKGTILAWLSATFVGACHTLAINVTQRNARKNQPNAGERWPLLDHRYAIAVCV